MTTTKMIESMKRLSIMISNLIEYLKHSGMKGEKFNGANQSSRSSRLRNEKGAKIKSQSLMD